MRVLLDTSVLRAALFENHQFHSRAFPWLERAQRGDIDGLVASHSLAEFYAHISGQPRPMLSTAHVLGLITENILPIFEIVSLESDDYQFVLERLALANIRGGAVYDALIVYAGLKANADQIVSLNQRDFLRVGAAIGANITVP